MSNPINYRERIKHVAKELSIDPVVLEDIIQMYWSKIRDVMEGPLSSNIDVIGLGVLSMIHKRVTSNAIIYERNSRGLVDTRSFREYSMKVTNEKKLEYLKKAQKLITDEQLRKQLKREQRYGKKTN